MKKNGFLARDSLVVLLSEIKANGFSCYGPTVQHGAIVYRPLENPDQLPNGIEVEQSPGVYRVNQTDTTRSFAWANGPQALKPLLFAPQENIWQVTRNADGKLDFQESSLEIEPIAVIGVRACDLAALTLQDQHFIGAHYSNRHYKNRRKNLFLVAVNCTHPAETCFCASTGDGPTVDDHFDLLLDELDDGFVVQVGSSLGASIFSALPLSPVTDVHRQQIDTQQSEAVTCQTRTLPSRNLYHDLFENLKHPHWENIADRCLSCGNCTAVCPTCFCSRESDLAEFDGISSQHVREWDTCFSKDHSYIHGITFRPDTKLRYRQWLTHKLGSWHAQYGRSGCVGCGRCISWCPVGIDLTTEVKAIVGDLS